MSSTHTRLLQIAIATALTVTALAGAAAAATNHIIYLHGRSMSSFPSSAMIPPGSLPATWDQFNPSYDGNKHLYDTSTNTAIKNALKADCRGTQNCVVITYSAGFNRLAYALNQLNLEGTPADNLLYVSAIASAGGGSPLARKVSHGLIGLIARLFGQSADIDSELWDTQWGTGGTYANLQNLPVPVWHVGGGTADACIRVRFLFFRMSFCGNDYFPTLAGIHWGDGVVPMYSACGYANQSGYSSCSDVGTKYTNRYWDTLGSYNYPGKNHISMLPTGMNVAARRVINLAFTPANSGTSIPTTTGGFPACDPTSNDCDLKESEGVNWFHIYMNAVNAAVANYRPATCYNGYCGTTTVGSIISVTDFVRTESVTVGGDSDQTYWYSYNSHEYKWSDPSGVVRYCDSDLADPTDIANPLQCPTYSQIPPPPPPCTDPCSCGTGSCGGGGDGGGG